VQIPAQITTIAAKIETIRANIGAIAAEIPQVSVNIRSITPDIRAVPGNIPLAAKSQVSGEIGPVAPEVSEIAAQIPPIRDDIPPIAANFQSVSSDIAPIGSNVSVPHAALEKVRPGDGGGSAPTRCCIIGGQRGSPDECEGSEDNGGLMYHNVTPLEIDRNAVLEIDRNAVATHHDLQPIPERACSTKPAVPSGV
jgi:hypothetical protein